LKKVSARIREVGKRRTVTLEALEWLVGLLVSGKNARMSRYIYAEAYGFQTNNSVRIGGSCDGIVGDPWARRCATGEFYHRPHRSGKRSRLECRAPWRTFALHLAHWCDHTKFGRLGSLSLTGNALYRMPQPLVYLGDCDRLTCWIRDKHRRTRVM